MERRGAQFVQLFFTSRPRFWLYLVGPLIVAIFLAASTEPGLLRVVQSHWVLLVLFLIFFSWPANLYLYGLNDLFDQKTDALNTKKETHETRLDTQQTWFVQRAVVLSGLIGLSLVLVLQVLDMRSPLIGSFRLSSLLMVVWLITAAVYSAPPVRFKARPFLDAVSNVFYWLPGVILFLVLNGTVPDWKLLLAFTFWTTAMHAFSAIPDIEPDMKAGIQTSATILGVEKTLWYCLGLWLGSTVLIGMFSTVLACLMSVYPLYVLRIIRKQKSVAVYYWYFPFLNGLVGFLAVLYIFVSGVMGWL